MRCPRCNSQQTNLSWMRELTMVYWCTPCHAPFEVDRSLVQSSARPLEPTSTGEPSTGRPEPSAK